MLNVLSEVEKSIQAFLEELPSRRLPGVSGVWNSLYIDYHPPIVARLWRQWGEYRIYLHKIYPCTRREALLHPHPWPSAMRVLAGTYEMGVGYGIGNEPPALAATLTLPAGASYEMTHQDAWHYVRPIGGPAYSLMVTGNPWVRESSVPGKKLRTLHDSEIMEMITVIRHLYGVLH